MNTRELKIIIKADGSVAVEEINKVDQGLDDLGRETQKTGRDLDKLVRTILQTGNSLQKTSQETKKAKLSWADFATGVNQAWEILGKGKQLLAEGWDIASQGAKLQEAKSSFDDYTRSIGKNSDEILAKLKKASGGTIDDMGLITTASKAMSLGVTTDSDKMANLLEIARNKARLFGIGTNQAFEDIVTGLGRNSPLILDNLGIKIPAGFDEMTKGMSDADKTAKLLELTLVEGNKQLKEMGGLTNTNADEMRAFEAEVTNLKNDFGGLLSQGLRPVVYALRSDIIPAVRDVISIFTEWLNINEKIEKTLRQQGSAGVIATKRILVADAEKRREELGRLYQQSSRGFSSYDQQRIGLNYAGDRNASIEEIRKAIWSQIGNANIEIARLTKEIEKAKVDGLESIKEAQANEIRKAQFAAQNILKGLDSQQGQWKTLNFLSSGYLGDESLVQFQSSAKNAGEAAKVSGKSAKEAAEYYYSLASAIDAAYASGQKLPVSLNNAQAGMESLGDAALSFADNLRLSNPDWFRGELARIAKEAAEVANTFGDVKINADLFSEKSLANAKTTVQYLQKGIAGYLNLTVPSQTTSAWDQYGGNILSAIWSAGTDSDDKKQKQKLSGTIAEAVAQGFANADLSNFANSMGSVLSQVFSRSIAQNNPILNAAGGINFGNLGINMAAGFALDKLTGTGGIFGKRQEKFKAETLQAASDLRSQMGQAWVKSFETSIQPYLTYDHQRELAEGRYSYNGTQTGYSWSNSGGGWPFGDKTRTYNLIDQGASAALAKLTKAIENAEKYNRSVEMGYELQSAKGLDYQALVAQESAYRRAAANAYGGTYSLNWSDGGKDTADLAEAAHEIKMAAAEMARSLGQANADRFATVAGGFAKYAPWLNSIQTPGNAASGLRISMRGDGIFGGATSWQNFLQAPTTSQMSDLSSAQQYDAFAALQTSLMDRNIPSYLLDMVKQAGTAGYELEELRLTDPELYTERYLEQIEKQMSASEEVMRRQEQIFKDGAKSYEERVSALDLYEQSMASYHQSKLDKLRTEKQLEEQEKQLMAEARQAKMESALSLIGEVSQRGDRIMIIQAGDAATAIEELMIEFVDNPEVTAVLQSTLETTKAKARWNKY
ncbi:MAG: hypothetical protein CVV41_06670 [Candidatus Riflebacteria bacterium HGW-Riflebacteria-1]|jgi:hypothetical protein|nr:MAG: hypothetical protein CVV41_06670 [Candidatus Riflebacteria bacterium HGW-Riflebacteria-1]